MVLKRQPRLTKAEIKYSKILKFKSLKNLLPVRTVSLLAISYSALGCNDLFTIIIGDNIYDNMWRYFGE